MIRLDKMVLNLHKKIDKWAEMTQEDDLRQRDSQPKPIKIVPEQPKPSRSVIIFIHHITIMAKYCSL